VPTYIITLKGDKLFPYSRKKKKELNGVPKNLQHARFIMYRHQKQAALNSMHARNFFHPALQKKEAPLN
jgi:hypothetical protein